MFQLKNGRNYESNTDDITKENIQVCVHNSAYSLNDKVVVSSLPPKVTAKQTHDNNYSVLNRENDAENYRTKNPCNTSEYDLLNHSKKASTEENTSGNFYNTADPVLNTGDQESAYDKANEGTNMYVYPRVGQSQFINAANQDIYSKTDQGNDDYSRAIQGTNIRNEDQTNHYSSANDSNIYSSAN